MEPGKRSKNFTEREKMLLIEVAKDFISIIDNKKTDGSSIEAKKQAWIQLTSKYNAISETGVRTEKQLHALYDNLKKKARKNMSDDKSEMYKTGGGTFCPKTTTVDEKVVALLTPQFKPLLNEFDSSAPYYKLVPETQESANSQVDTSQDFLVIVEEKEDSVPEIPSVPRHVGSSKRPLTPLLEDTPKIKRVCLTEMKKKSIHNLSESIIKRKNQKQINEDTITTKKLEILEIQRQQEVLKLEKTKILLDLDIELKQTLLENAKMDLEFKKKNFNLS
ncbi:hypothetical protein evm_001960 [Chilo suppressalis]|nr:hypothetical protein evm_001960 [Chilo suppressalis]